MTDHPTSVGQDDEGRPSREEVAPSNVVTTDTPIIARCRQCGHVIWSELGIDLGIGPECKRSA